MGLHTEQDTYSHRNITIDETHIPVIYDPEYNLESVCIICKKEKRFHMETIVGFLFLIACGIGMHKVASFVGNKFKFAEKIKLFYISVKELFEKN